MKFSTKLFLIYIIITSSLVIPFCSHLYLSSAQEIEKQVKLHLKERARHVMDKIERLLFERFNDIQVLAESPVFRTTGVPPAILESILVSYHQHYQVYSSLSFFNAKQIRVADTSKVLIGEPVNPSPWVKEVFEQGRVSAGTDIHFSESLKKQVVFFAAPVRDDEAQIIGAVVARLPLENIHSVINQGDDDEFIYADLFDRDNNLIYSNHETDSLLKKIPNLEHWDNGTGQGTIHAIAKEQGFSNFPGNGWTLLVHYPKEEAFRPINELHLRILVWGAVLLALLMLSIFFITRRATRAILILHDATIKLSHDQLDTKVPITSNDEIGQLSNAFNNMVDLLKESIQALKQSRERFDLAMRGANDGLWDWDFENDEMYFSPRWQAMIGSTNAPLGEPFEEWNKRIHPDDFKKVISKMRSYIDKEIDTYDNIYRIRHDDGHYIWVLARGLGIWNEYGEITRFVGTLTDITTSKQAADNLKQAKSQLEQNNLELTRFKVVLDMVLDSIFIVDSFSFKFYYANQGATKQLGYTTEELFDMTPLDIQSEVTAMQMRTLLSPLLNSTQTAVRFETLSKRKNGELFPAELLIQYIETQQICCFVMVMRDITEHKNLEKTLQEYNEKLEREVSLKTEELQAQNEELFAQSEELLEKHQLLQKAKEELRNYNQKLEQEIAAKTKTLQESEERFNLAMKGTSDGLWDWNLETNKIYFSSRWKSMLGYAEEEISDDPNEWSQRLHPDDLQPAVANIQNFLNGRRPKYDIFFRMRHKDGHYLWILSRGFAVHNKEGKAIRLVGTHVDLTEQKRIEAELQEAKEAAETANRAKSFFLANMSHELRTPLNGILGYAQILTRDKQLTPKQREGVAIIQRSGDYLLTLINDVLDLAKIEANRVELYPSDFNLIDFLCGLVELFEMRTQQKGISFAYQPLTSLPKGIRADEKRLRQILINLIGNAVKFTHKGGITLKVSYGNNQLRFQVEDTGVGIAEEELEKIFQPFQQAGDHSRRPEGTGLGLSITKRLVEMMGGEIHVKSQLGHGSQFGLILNCPEVSELVKSKQNDTLMIIGYQGKRQKILVIDDKWENRAVLVNLLNPLGFEVIEAGNGQEGIERAREYLPDLIIMDLVMPKMDGFETVRRLRKMEKFKKIPMIAASASVFDYQQQQSFAAGCDEFIPNPIHAEMLLELLQRHLEIEWIHEASEQQKEGASALENKPHSPLATAIPQQSANELFNCAKSGDIDGIYEQIRILENMKGMSVFVAQLQTLAEEFELERICKLVAPYINGQ